MRVELMNNTGFLVDVLNLKKEDITSDVIILGSCRINRFLGQTIYPYPVAAHLIGGYLFLKENNAPDMLMKQWLIHEAFESYTGVDLPSPLKQALPLYKEAEQKALKVIGETFGVDPVEGEAVKALDRSIMVAEAFELMPNLDYWSEFARENNIVKLPKNYVIREELCNEKSLMTMLSSIWKDVFTLKTKGV